MIESITQFISDHRILSFSWIGLFIAVVYLTIKQWTAKVKTITPPAAVELINKEGGIVVDVRANNSFKQGHIVDAHNILPIDIKNGSIGVINKFKTNPVIVVCDNGLSGMKPAEILFKAGFERVFLLKEGITGWSNNKLPLVMGKK